MIAKGEDPELCTELLSEINLVYVNWSQNKNIKGDPLPEDEVGEATKPEVLQKEPMAVDASNMRSNNPLSQEGGASSSSHRVRDDIIINDGGDNNNNNNIPLPHQQQQVSEKQPQAYNVPISITDEAGGLTALPTDQSHAV